MQGKTIVKIYDRSGLSILQCKGSERDLNTDRLKGQRKVVNRRVRKRLKNEFKSELKQYGIL